MRGLTDIRIAQLPVLYRIVRSLEPDDEDFKSNAAKGKKPFKSANAEVIRTWDGISTHASPDESRAHAREMPHLGAFIAQLDIPDQPNLRVEKTFSGTHHTIWGDPAELRGYVANVEAV
jgi:hypothetical protein